MGCDIHLYTEKRKGDEWVCVDHFKINPYYRDFPNEEEPYQLIPIYDTRDYLLFATLANVRNYSGITPIDAPRGLPNDVSDTVKEASENWGVDGHSHSWLTAKELFVHKNKNPFTKCSGMISPKAQEALDKLGVVPNMCCQGTTEEGWERKDWIIPNSVLNGLIEALKERMCEELWIWDSLDAKEKNKRIWEEADNFRIVFWFDN